MQNSEPKVGVLCCWVRYEAQLKWRQLGNCKINRDKFSLAQGPLSHCAGWESKKSQENAVLKLGEKCPRKVTSDPAAFCLSSPCIWIVLLAGRQLHDRLQQAAQDGIKYAELRNQIVFWYIQYKEIDEIKVVFSLMCSILPPTSQVFERHPLGQASTMSFLLAPCNVPRPWTSKHFSHLSDIFDNPPEPVDFFVYIFYPGAKRTPYPSLNETV